MSDPVKDLLLPIDGVPKVVVVPGMNKSTGVLVSPDERPLAIKMPLSHEVDWLHPFEDPYVGPALRKRLEEMAAAGRIVVLKNIDGDRLVVRTDDGEADQ